MSPDALTFEPFGQLLQYNHEPVGKCTDPSNQSKQRKGLKTYFGWFEALVMSFFQK